MADRNSSSEQPPVEEVRLFELVRMVREWVARSFSPQQEERFQEKGRLCARFQVALGEAMTAQLQAYVAASFALRLLKFRVVKRDEEGKPPKEFVEVLLNPEARSLYAEKCPDAVAKNRLQLASVSGAADGLVDVSGEDREQDTPGPARLENGPKQLALGNGQLALDCVPAATPAPKPRRPASDAGTKGPSTKKRRDGEPRHEAAPPQKAATPAPVSGTGSVWEQCVAHEVPPGEAGLAEARDALDQSLARLAAGGLASLKAEKDIVSWLKGLLARTVSATELRDTKIGLTVNACRKHREPFISGLAVSILTAWKRAWQEAEKADRRRVAR